MTLIKLINRINISIQVRLSRLWRETPFFIQGQMDIHPISPWYNPDFVKQTGGFFPGENNKDRRVLDHECWDGVRRDMIILLLRSIEERQIPGRFADLGVSQGGTARLSHHYAPGRELHLFDTFTGFDIRDTNKDTEVTSLSVDQNLFKNTSVDLARGVIAPRNDHVHFHAGFFPDSFPIELQNEHFSFVHLDADLYVPIIVGLKTFFPLLSQGGIILVHDYNAWPGARRAVDEFCSHTGVVPIPMPDKSGSCVLLKS